MFNYDPAANTDDGSCIPVVIGCTDPTALNFDSTANTNSGCIYPILGCTDPTAFNFDPNANTNDGSCVPVVIGCTDPTEFHASRAQQHLTFVSFVCSLTRSFENFSNFC